jgi:uncharacterized protein (DUF1800 family)
MQLDPTTAWQPFVPGNDHPWSRRLVAHAYRRAGFGATTDDISAGLKLGPRKLARQLIRGGEEKRESDFFALAQTAVATNNIENLAGGWLYRMLNTQHPLREKMTLFWHGHFATGDEKVQNASLMHTQNSLLRQHALGDFKQLAHGIAKDPAMLIYLDSESNRKAHPNENFARELMELFVLGEGNYTETDVRELARCFTGWELRRDRFRFNRYQHDRGEKSVLSQSGPLTGEQGVDIVLRSKAGPQFIVRKLLRFFVCEEPELSDELVRPMAEQLHAADWNIGPVMETILASRLFYSTQSIGRRIRSPVELVVGLLRSLNGSTNVSQLSKRLGQIGQGLFFPPNVKGWDGGRTWINSSTLLGRANLIRELMSNEKTRFGGTKLDEYLKPNATTADQFVERFEELLLAVPLRESARNELKDLLKSDEGSVDQRLRVAVHLMSLQPEFQLC